MDDDLDIARPTPASDTDATLRASNEIPLTLSAEVFLQQEGRQSAEPWGPGKKRSNFKVIKYKRRVRAQNNVVGRESLAK